MKTIHVAAAIIQDGDRFLAAQRGYGDFKGGWEFPGGKLEPNEAADAACVREIQEELNVTVTDLKFLCTAEHDYDTFHLSMDCYLCRIDQGAIEDHEHEDLRWFTIDEIWRIDWLPADIQVAEALEKATRG